MSRIARGVLAPASIFLVTSRGVARCAIVRDDFDRMAFTGRLADVAARFDWAVHAWCLMDNHFHLVVEAPLDWLSRGMHRLNFLHAQRFNERYDRVGHLFQSRFDTRVIDSEESLARACAYVEANPVRAALCAAPVEWRWSSAGFYAGEPARWTGARAGAHAASGETAPSRPFSRR